MLRLLLLAGLLAGCVHKTRLDCIDICKEHGLKYVRVEHGAVGYDPMVRKVMEKDACRCE